MVPYSSYTTIQVVALNKYSAYQLSLWKGQGVERGRGGAILTTQNIRWYKTGQGSSGYLL
jgi:hypothetical protein